MEDMGLRDVALTIYKQFTQRVQCVEIVPNILLNRIPQESAAKGLF